MERRASPPAEPASIGAGINSVLPSGDLPVVPGKVDDFRLVLPSVPLSFKKKAASKGGPIPAKIPGYLKCPPAAQVPTGLGRCALILDADFREIKSPLLGRQLAALIPADLVAGDHHVLQRHREH